MFAVPSGVVVESDAMESLPPAVRVTMAGRMTGAHRLTGVARWIGRNLGLKAGAIGSGRSVEALRSAAGAP